MLPDMNDCAWCEVASAYAVHALPEDEVGAAVAHFTSCPICHGELMTLRPVIDSFVSWPTDILRPRVSLQARLARRIAEEAGRPPEFPPIAQGWSAPEWMPAAPGIECRLLANDTQRQRVSMLVRFAPGARFTAHTHAWNEECHLLEGDLWIDERVVCGRLCVQRAGQQAYQRPQ